MLCVPGTPVPTSAARAVLPPEVPHAAAAANSARAALLVAALTGRPELLMDATEDFLHQRYRAAAMPRHRDPDRRAARGRGPRRGVRGRPVGPGLRPRRRRPKPGDMTAIAGPDWQVQTLAVDTDGATVQPAWGSESA